MSDSTDSELEIVNPSPVRAHTKYSVAQKTKEKSAVCTQPVNLFTRLNFWTPKLLWSSTYDPNSTLYPVLAKFLIPSFLGTDCFVGSIPALLVTSLLSKIFVLKRSQLKISGMDPGQTCLFC